MKEKTIEKDIEKDIEKGIEKRFDKCFKRGRNDHKYIHDSSNGVYCLGVIGAAIFFIGQATSFWMGVLGLLKAFIWPVFFVYEALKFLIN